MATDTPDSSLTGAAFDLAKNGYAPMPDLNKKDEEEAIGSDSASLREAAEQRSGPRDEIVVREYLDQDGKPVAANEAITLARAGRDYANASAADKAAAESETSAELAARVDALRAEALARDPDAAEIYGFEPQDTKADRAKPEQSESEKPESKPRANDSDGATGLDPELEKALQHPQVRQAIDERIGEAEKTRQGYLDGLAAATQIAQVSFLGQFPELAGIAPGRTTQALEYLTSARGNQRCWVLPRF